MPWRDPTLRGRVSAVGGLVVAVWLLMLTAGFSLFLHGLLQQQADRALQARAEAVASTVIQSSAGRVSVAETGSDDALDSGVWVYTGLQILERGSGSAAVQAAAGRRAADPGSYATVGSTRLYSMPVDRAGATVVAATGLAAYHDTATAAVEAAALLGALAVAGAYLALRFATARALQPVQAMTARAAAWSERGRADRFGPHQRYRELSELGAGLDALSDRLAAVLRHERQLSGELSHELRTPLSRIVAAPELSSATRAAVESMADILETLLSTARIDHGRLPGTCRLSAVLAGLGQPVRIDPGADAVGVDAAVATRILAPVLDNARRHARSRVVVEARRGADGIMVDIADDGPGIRAGLAEQVFQPGFRAVPDDGHDGAGLGLPLARRLARAADGDVMVVPGAVRIVLPAA